MPRWCAPKTLDVDQPPRRPSHVFAATLRILELELQEARQALSQDESAESARRYMRALARYDSLQGMFPFVAAGAADET